MAEFDGDISSDRDGAAVGNSDWLDRRRQWLRTKTTDDAETTVATPGRWTYLIIFKTQPMRTSHVLATINGEEQCKAK